MERGDIFLVDFEPKIGHEQGFKRPALILSTQEFNTCGLKLIFVIPITTRKKDYPSHVPIKLKYDSYIKCEDLKSVSHRRIIKKLDTKASNEIMTKVEEIVKRIFKFR